MAMDISFANQVGWVLEPTRSAISTFNVGKQLPHPTWSSEEIIEELKELVIDEPED